MKSEVTALLDKDIKWKIFKLKKRGWSNQEIAIQLNMKKSDVIKAIKEIVDEQEEETAIQVLEVRQLIIERLGDAVDAIYDEVVDGKLSAIDRMLAINRQYADLLSLNIQRVDITTGGQSLNLNAEELANAARMARLELRLRGGSDIESSDYGEAESIAGMD